MGIGSENSRPVAFYCARARNSKAGGFLYTCEGQKKLKNSSLEVLKEVLAHNFTHPLQPVFTPSFPSRRERRGIAILKNTPLLYIDSAARFASACKCDYRGAVANRAES
jgi:hypothetical protein